MNAEQKQDDDEMPASVPGHASNPAADGAHDQTGNQLLGKKAEKYLREGGNIEDLPDEEDWQDAEKIRQKEKNK